MPKTRRKPAAAPESAQARRRRQIHEGWCHRHPARAAEERALRLANARVVADNGHHQNGTPETHARAKATRQGTVARLFEAGHLDVHQLAAAESVRAVHARVTREVSVGCSSLEARVDCSARHGGAFWEALGAVRAEIAYGRWRTALGGDLALVLALVIEEASVAAAARAARCKPATARGRLSAALDLWDRIGGEVAREVDAADVLAAHAGLF